MSTYPRTEYEMTEADLEKILDACKPVPYMIIGGHPPSSPQENANRAWAELGHRMGFEPMSVRPIEGKEMRFFTAIPSETESQKEERVKRQAEEKRQHEITRLKKLISDSAVQLAELTKE